MSALYYLHTRFLYLLFHHYLSDIILMLPLQLNLLLFLHRLFLHLNLRKNGCKFFQKNWTVSSLIYFSYFHIYESSLIFLLLTLCRLDYLNLISHIIVPVYNLIYHINHPLPLYNTIIQTFNLFLLKNIYIFLLCNYFVFSVIRSLNIFLIKSTRSILALHLYNIFVGNRFSP